MRFPKGVFRHSVTAFLLLAAASLLASLFGDPAWFALPALQLVFFGIGKLYRLAAAAAAPLLLYSLLYARYIIPETSSGEYLFLLLLWTGAAAWASTAGFSRRKRLEEKTEERRRYLEALLQSSHSALVTLDRNHVVQEWNPGAQQLFGYTAEEAAGRTIDALVASFDKQTFEEAQRLSDQVSAGGSVQGVETVRYTKDGSPVHVIATAAPIRVGREHMGYVGSYTDITRLKHSEQRIERLLEEKENLLKEVHHRIKNHMNVIRSILSLQRQRVATPETAAVLQEAEDRIALMQGIYHKLYTRSDSSSINIRDLIEDLIGDLARTYAPNSSIRISTDVEPVEVSARFSLPLGIIVNELVTNAYKYAFPQGSPGDIWVSLRFPEPNTCFLEVTDNGQGIPEEYIRNVSYGFGLMLVRSYAAQFDGTLELENRNGTRAAVTLYCSET